MKRCLLLLLVAVLPFQVTSLASEFICPHDGGAGAHVSAVGHAADATHAHSHAHDGGDGDDSRPTGSGLDCGAFHFVALVCPETWTSTLPRAGGTAHEVEYSGYKSYIPDGLDRPKWRFAA